MKLLNLDKVKVVTRQVQLFGRTLDLADNTVGQMIDALQVAHDPSDGAENFKAMVRFASELLPDATEDEIRKLNVQQLRALLEFANASDEDVVEGSEEVGDDAKK